MLRHSIVAQHFVIMSGTRGWQSLIRFEDSTGQVRYGEPEDDLKRATVWQGDSLLQLLETDNVVDVKQVRSRIQAICVQLNRCNPDSRSLHTRYNFLHRFEL